MRQLHLSVGGGGATFYTEQRHTQDPRGAFDGKSPTKANIYADGACSSNLRPGGYGVVLVHGNRRKELSGGFRLTTNSRMEITAAIAGLRSLKTWCVVTH